MYESLGFLPPNFITDEIKGYTSLCLEDIIHANPLIVHSKKLQKIIYDTYKKDTIYIPFCSYNGLKKYIEKELIYLKKNMA